MPPEGMVHALELIHKLLKPAGQLIDIHPSGQTPPVELLDGKRYMHLGYVQETDNFIEYAQANAALDRAVANGWFNLGLQTSFTFCTCAPSVAELWEYIHKTWSDAILPDQIAAQAIEAQVNLPGQKVVITETVNLSLFVSRIQ